MQEIILKIGILKEDYQKAFKELALVFLLNPFPLGKILRNKNGLELLTIVTLQTTTQVQKNSFISDMTPDQV